jgi:hypothetical protein
MEGDELSTAYASADVFVFPSSVETFGNVTLEAAASGLPLVVDSGCSGHLVRHGISGFACSEDDLDAYVDSTLCLVVDDARRKAFSQEGRKLALQFEKGVVCRRMLENYCKVTEEFYCDYGGHHANRDKIYLKKDHSFDGGNHPRPMVLILVEFLFVFSFKIMYQMALALVYIQESMARRNPVTTSSPSPKPHIVVTSKHNTDVPILRSITEVDESDSEGEFQEIRVDGAVWTDDDETATTASDDSGSQSESMDCISEARLRGECSVSHILAKGFVKMLQYQFRMESRLRHGLNALCAPSKWDFINRKRKNSGTESDFSELLLDSDDSFEASSTGDLETLLTQPRVDRLSMRRII